MKVNFELNSKQYEIYNMIFNENGELKTSHNFTHFAFFGAFRCGKSWVMMLVTMMLCLTYPNCNGTIIRMTYGELADSSIVQYLEAFHPINGVLL